MHKEDGDTEYDIHVPSLQGKSKVPADQLLNINITSDSQASELLKQLSQINDQQLRDIYAMYVELMSQGERSNVIEKVLSQTVPDAKLTPRGIHSLENYILDRISQQI